MNRLTITLLLLPCLCHAQAYLCADASGRKIFSSEPCPTSQKTVRRVEGDPNARYAPPTDFQAQLENIQRNRAEIAARNGSNYPATNNQMTEQEKLARCQNLRNEIDSIDAWLNNDWRNRSMSSAEQRQNQRDRKQQLQQERSNLNC